MKPKIIAVTDLHKVDIDKDCFIIKNAFSVNKCNEILEFLEFFSKTYRDNEKVFGENWHYQVSMGSTRFESYLFNNLSKLDNHNLTDAFRLLFNLYSNLGEETTLSNFDREICVDDFQIDFKIINPLVFHYFCDESHFDFHKHDARNQRFQLLMNLTQPGVDYVGGETLIYLREGVPDKKVLDLENDYVVFGDDFEKGDIFSFPYGLWHKVNTPRKTGMGIDARVSLLMPIGRRNIEGYPNEYL